MEENEQIGDVVAETRVCTFENCLVEVLGKCRECHLDFCIDHASEVDPANFCCNCLVPADAEVTQAALVDSEGTRHQGRSIKPTGKAYRLSTKMVFEMTDQELKDFIEHETSVVHDIERIREYHMITLGMAESEVYRRDIALAKKEGNVLKFGFETQYVPKVQLHETKTRNAKSTVSKSDKIASMLSGLGISPQELAKLIQNLPKKGKK
jgi:hypothetical protein